MNHTITSEEINDIRNQLLNIGEKSLFIINESRSKKDNIWEGAIDINYRGQRLFKLLAEIEKHKTNSNTELPRDIDYSTMPGLSNEIKQKLTEFAPKTIGHAARIEGVTPASLSQLLVHLKKQKMKKAEGLWKNYQQLS